MDEPEKGLKKHIDEVQKPRNRKAVDSDINSNHKGQNFHGGLKALLCALDEIIVDGSFSEKTVSYYDRSHDRHEAGRYGREKIVHSLRTSFPKPCIL